MYFTSLVLPVVPWDHPEPTKYDLPGPLAESLTHPCLAGPTVEKAPKADVFNLSGELYFL